jgi:hypothetical protein
VLWHKIGILLVIAISSISTACAWSATNKLEHLVETSARRLAIAKQGVCISGQ